MDARVVSVLVALCVGVLAAAGCGSSKPEFCSKAIDLQGALSTLKTNVASADFSSVQSDVQTVKADVDAVATSAKSDFPSETSAVQSSISALTSTVKSFPSSPSPAEVVRLVGQVNAAVTAVDDFNTATSSSCD